MQVFLLFPLLKKIFFLSFIHIVPLALSEGNFKTLNASGLLSISGRSMSIIQHLKQSHIQKRKVMSCKKLHSTEGTPWIAIILHTDSGRLLCLGSIIDEKHILTARLCVTNTDPSKFKILLGYLKAYWGRHSQVITVKNVHKHPYGLVILELQKRITFSKTVSPIRLLGAPASEVAPALASAAPAPAPASGKAVPQVPLFKTRADLLKPSNRTRHFNKKANIFQTKNFLNESIANFKDDLTSRISRAEGEIEEEISKGFSETYPEIENVYIVGFPVTYMDAIGEPLSKTLTYVMREDAIVAGGTDCKSKIDRPQLPEKYDKYVDKRFYCIKGVSHFCWGCMGGPILDPKTMKQVGVIGVATAPDNCEKSAVQYTAFRVDVFLKWIRTNSYYV